MTLIYFNNAVCAVH